MTLRALRPLAAAGALAALLLATSCLDREEEIVVGTDGTVRVTHTIRGQTGDIDGGAAGLPTGPDFETVRTVVKPGTDDEETTVVATAWYPSVADMPESFAYRDAPHAEVDLRFPTELRVTEEADGTHFVLVRRYEPREWARFDLHHRRAFPDEVQEIIDRGPDEELPPEERLRVMAALAAYERGKNEEWLRDALAATVEDAGARLDAFHAGRSALDEFFERNASPEQLDELLAADEATIGRRAEELQRDLDRALADAVARAAPGSAAGEPASGVETFLDALAAARRATHVTEDLADEEFIVRVRLPGRIVAHDADEVADDFAVWRFEGRDLRDRTQTIRLHTVLGR